MIKEDSSIVLSRISNPKYCFRAFSIYIDGTKIKKIKNGETIEIGISPGRYQIGAKMDFIKSELCWVKIAKGETKHLEIIPTPPDWKSTFHLIIILVFLSLGGMLFGSIGGAIGIGFGWMLFRRFACKPQFIEKNL